MKKKDKKEKDDIFIYSSGLEENIIKRETIQLKFI